MTPVQSLTPQPFALADIAQSLGKTPQTITVAVGMSGGVDSSVSALLLKQAGFDVVGLFMKNWEEDDGTKYCTALQDFADARAVADTIGIPLQAVNFATDYWDNVFEIFLHEYQIGHTPNPDILCNKEIKFKAFLDYAQSLGADFIATGHYARRTHAKDGKAGLLRGLDAAKDQSYFLHAVSGEKLAKTLFPIGELQKSQVRAIAKHHHLATANKKDSTGICFIGERKFKTFLQSYLPAQPGDIYSDDGKKIGRHDGLMYYTIGQRSGLGIGGVAGRSDAPWFVLEKDLSNNRLIVGQGHNHPALQYRSLHAIRPNWVIAPPPLDTPYQCDAKTRYRQADQPCTITTNIAAASIDQELDVNFYAPVQAVTPGQSVVFYAGECCLGGAVIDSASH